MAKKQAAPDPDRLVRDRIGAYHSEDDRFQVHSEGAGWYLTDTQRTNDFGLEVVIGPLATLDEAKAALARQRAEPAGASDGGAASEPPRTKPASAPSPRKPATRTPRSSDPTPIRPVPDPKPVPEPESEPEPGSPYIVARFIVAPRRRTRDARDAIADALRRINESWVSGHPDSMEADLHPSIVVMEPGSGKRTEGQDAVIEAYRDFVAGGSIREYVESELSIDLWGDTAVATCRFALEWDADGEPHRDTGQDVFVFTHESGAWVAVWRTVIPDAE